MSTDLLQHRFETETSSSPTQSASQAAMTQTVHSESTTPYFSSMGYSTDLIEDKKPVILSDTQNSYTSFGSYQDEQSTFLKSLMQCDKECQTISSSCRLQNSVNHTDVHHRKIESVIPGSPPENNTPLATAFVVETTAELKKTETEEEKKKNASCDESNLAFVLKEENEKRYENSDVPFNLNETLLQDQENKKTLTLDNFGTCDKLNRTLETSEVLNSPRHKKTLYPKFDKNHKASLEMHSYNVNAETSFVKETTKQSDNRPSFDENKNEEQSFNSSNFDKTIETVVEVDESSGETKLISENVDLQNDKTPVNEDPCSLSFWNEKLKQNKIILTNSPLVLHQPPPHFNLFKEQVLADFKDKKLYLFLDYDGTLTPIVSNPWEAVLSPCVRQLLFDLASSSQNLVTVGIVTGRALSCVKNFVQIVASENLNFIYAASHGFHIEAAGKMLHHRVGSKFIPILKKAAAEVQEALDSIPGIILEDNEFAVSVHYRNSPEGSQSIVEKIVLKILENYPQLKMTRGRKVFELRINVVWDKGRAVFWLLNAMRVDPFGSETRVVYIGDDLTDEDAFRTIRRLKNSLTVLVSSVPSKRPTAAKCYVNDPDEVAKILQLFLSLSRESIS